MSSVPPNHEHISLMLTEVLSDIGINEDMIRKRRACALFNESIYSLPAPRVGSIPTFLFGSQSEGCTTRGLHSDDDLLYCYSKYNVIRDWTDWKHDVINLLMVQDETAPGYCLLQLLRNDVPLAANYCPTNVYYQDAKGRALLKNTKFDSVFASLGADRHGPAGTPPVRDGIRETDFVVAYHCVHWPEEGRRWLNRRSIGGWPSDLLKSESEKSGCFIVPVNSKIRRGLEELEWRISTSVAERYLMFSLNITQIGCYTLMKMLLKSNEVFQGVISSYMCKTVLFHCIENTCSDFWRDQNLLLCLNQTLLVLYNFIYYGNCPHFIIPENNLMAGRISAEQRRGLLDAIQHMIESYDILFSKIRPDDFGVRLQTKINRGLGLPRHVQSPEEVRIYLTSELCYHLAHVASDKYSLFVSGACNITVQKQVRNLILYYHRCHQLNLHSNYLEQAAWKYFKPSLCSTIGTLLASYYTSINMHMPEIVWDWLKLGLNSDVSSGWLKLATVCYSVGDMNVTEAILRHVDQQYARDVVLPVCGCYTNVIMKVKPEFRLKADQVQVTEFRQIVAYCVRFSCHDVHIVPTELRQEYSRSTQEDIYRRHIEFDYWMDFAVVDSLPYLYFLQYKTYGRLRNRGKQLGALHNLQQVACEGQYQQHKETTFNLLGQCMEREKLPIDAFLCYERSLQVRPRNNAANFHTSRLLSE